MKIHQGTKFGGAVRCRWVEQHITYQWELEDLVNGLCSKYIRDRVDEDEALPSRLTRAQVVDTVKEQYRYWGINAVWTWSDDCDNAEDGRDWATRIILAVLPDIEVPKGEA